jgi:hypothetical protein
MAAAEQAVQISGDMVIGQRTLRGTAGLVRAVDPARDATIAPDFGLATDSDVDLACELAAKAFDAYRSTTAAPPLSSAPSFWRRSPTASWPWARC